MLVIWTTTLTQNKSFILLYSALSVDIFISIYCPYAKVHLSLAIEGKNIYTYISEYYFQK